MPCKIIIADDHPLFRAALRQSLGHALKDLCFIEADSFAAVREVAAANPDADLILLDLQMPGSHGFSALSYVRDQHPALPVMVVSAHDEPKVVHRAIDYGAAGFLPKSTPLPVLVQALKAVLAGEIWLPPGLPPREAAGSAQEADFAHRMEALTGQQLRVLGLMTDGLLNKQIADRLDVSEATVKAHVTAILRKLGVHSRTQAALAYRGLSFAADAIGR